MASKGRDGMGRNGVDPRLRARRRPAACLLLAVTAIALVLPAAGGGGVVRAAEGITRGPLTGTVTRSLGDANGPWYESTITVNLVNPESDLSWTDDGDSTATALGEWDKTTEGNDAYCHVVVHDWGSYTGSGPPWFNSYVPIYNSNPNTATTPFRWDLLITKFRQVDITKTGSDHSCTSPEPQQETTTYGHSLQCTATDSEDSEGTFTVEMQDPCSGTLVSYALVGEGPLEVNSNADTADAAIGNGLCDINTSETGDQCTLRAAIQEANTRTGAQTITFNIGGSGVPVISPDAPLEAVTVPVTINGKSQPGANAVRIDGSLAGTGAKALQIQGGTSTVKGLQIGGFDGSAIELTGTGNNVVESNVLGLATVSTPTAGLLPNRYGVVIDGTNNNLIGGATVAKQNTIQSGLPEGAPSQENLLDFGVGVHLKGGAQNTTIQGNKIGGSPFGIVVGGATDTTVGGSTAAKGNLLSHNQIGIAAIHQSGAATNGVTMKNNLIGAEGITNLPDAGILVAGNAQNVLIGGESTGNVIGGNGAGVFVYDAPGVTISGNKIGAIVSQDAVANGIGVLAMAARNLNIGMPGIPNVMRGDIDVLINGGRAIRVRGNLLQNWGTKFRELGIGVEDAKNVQIGGRGQAINTIEKMAWGLRVNRSEDVTLKGGRISKSKVGIEITRSRNVTIEDANMLLNDVGVAVGPMSPAANTSYPTQQLETAQGRIDEILASQEVSTGIQIAKGLVGEQEIPNLDDSSEEVKIIGSKINEGKTGVMLAAEPDEISLGGATSDSANEIMRNDNLGVVVVGPFRRADKVQILRNKIARNGAEQNGLNTDVADDRDPTAFSRPRLNRANEENGDVTIRGSLAGKSNTRYKIFIYRSDRCGVRRQGEAENFVRVLEKRTNENGNATFKTTVSDNRDDFYSAMATPATPNDGSSGELSLCEEAT